MLISVSRGEYINTPIEERKKKLGKNQVKRLVSIGGVKIRCGISIGFAEGGGWSVGGGGGGGGGGVDKSTLGRIEQHQ